MLENLINFNYQYNNDASVNIDKRFFIEFKPISRTLNTWKNELLITSESIANSTNKPIMICLSGGIDSEVLARSFLEKSIDFVAIIIRHTFGTNEHDIQYAIDFCNQNSVKYKIVELDFERFLKVNIGDYIKQGYRGTNIFHYFQIYVLEMIEMLGGCAIMAAGEQLYYTINGIICQAWSPSFLMALQWCKNNNSQHYPFFFYQNSELFASYMEDDLLKVLLNNPRYYTTHMSRGISLEKQLIYHSHWENMIRRPKLNGFEKMWPDRTKKHEELKNLFPDIKLKYFPVDTIKKQLHIK